MARSVFDHARRGYPQITATGKANLAVLRLDTENGFIVHNHIHRIASSDNSAGVELDNVLQSMGGGVASFITRTLELDCLRCQRVTLFKTSGSYVGQIVTNLRSNSRLTVHGT